MSSQNEISGNIATGQIYTSEHNLDNDNSNPTLKQSTSTGSENPEQQHGENEKLSTTIEAIEQQQQHGENEEASTPVEAIEQQHGENEKPSTPIEAIEQQQQQHSENEKPSTPIEAIEQKHGENEEVTTIEHGNANDANDIVRAAVGAIFSTGNEHSEHSTRSKTVRPPNFTIQVLEALDTEQAGSNNGALDLSTS